MQINKRVYKDKEGNGISVEKWGELFENFSYRVVKQEKIADKFISTMWIGVPQLVIDSKGIRFSGYFGTGIFNVDGKLEEERRYETLQEAEKGHLETVTNEKFNALRNGNPEDLERIWANQALNYKLLFAICLYL